MKGDSQSRRILLLGSGRGEGGLAICRAFGKAGHEVSILRLSSESAPAQWSRYCHRSLYVGAPAASVSEYVVGLKRLLRSEEFDFLVPIDDFAFELTYLDYVGVSALTRVMGPSPAAYAMARDQLAAMALMDRIGLRRPASCLIKRDEPTPVSVLPCCVSARVPCAVIADELQRFSVRRANTLEELDAKLRDDLPRVDVVLQALTGGRRVRLNFCAIDGEVLGATESLSLHELSLRGDSYWKIQSPNPGRLAVIRAVARELAWTGFMSIECREEREALSVTKLIWSPNDAIALSRFAGVDFYNLLWEGFEGVRPADIAFPREAVYLRDFSKDIRWAAAKAGKQRDAKSSRLVDRVVRAIAEGRGACRPRAAKGSGADASPIGILDTRHSKTIGMARLLGGSAMDRLGPSCEVHNQGQFPSHRLSGQHQPQRRGRISVPRARLLAR